MKSKISILTFLLAITLFNCNQGSQFTDFKYADKPATITCEGTNSKLLNEAFYSFENDITNHFNLGNGVPRLDQACSQVLRNSVYGTLKIEDMVSKHTAAIFEALKSEDDLWDANNTKSHLNYNSKLLNCITTSVEDEALKTTLKALISTNSMSPKLFGPAILNKSRSTLSDKNLTVYIALDLYYAKMFDIDFSKIDFNRPEKKPNLNTTPSVGQPAIN